MDLSKSTELEILYTNDANDANYSELLSKLIKHILKISNIYHLNICSYQLSLSTLIQILDLLPGINSIKKFHQ